MAAPRLSRNTKINKLNPTVIFTKAYKVLPKRKLLRIPFSYIKIPLIFLFKIDNIYIYYFNHMKRPLVLFEEVWILRSLTYMK